MIFLRFSKDPVIFFILAKTDAPHQRWDWYCYRHKESKRVFIRFWLSLDAVDVQNIGLKSTRFIEFNFRYTPAQQGSEFNSGASQRIIRMVEAQKDPMEPPKYKINKKVSRVGNWYYHNRPIQSILWSKHNLYHRIFINITFYDLRNESAWICLLVLIFIWISIFADNRKRSPLRLMKMNKGKSVHINFRLFGGTAVVYVNFISRQTKFYSRFSVYSCLATLTIQLSFRVVARAARCCLRLLWLSGHWS